MFEIIITMMSNHNNHHRNYRRYPDEKLPWSKSLLGGGLSLTEGIWLKTSPRYHRGFGDELNQFEGKFLLSGYS